MSHIHALRLFIASFIAAGFVCTTAVAAHASWTSNNCNSSGPTVVTWSRAEAQSYAATGSGDGYEWGGGCWNGSGHDNTPGAPDSGGEGADCSGYTFKSWAMALDFSGARHRWGIMTDVHGYYTAADFKGGTGAANPIGKGYADTGQMDAFASTSHIGMIYTEGSGGTDTIIEAKGDAQGTGIWARTYRSDPSYGGTKRISWDTYCPQCG